MGYRSAATNLWTFLGVFKVRIEPNTDVSPILAKIGVDMSTRDLAGSFLALKVSGRV